MVKKSQLPCRGINNANIDVIRYGGIKERGENMSVKRVVGIDFGTSTSVVRVKRYEENGQPMGDRLSVSNVIFDGYDNVPTLVQIPDDAVISPELKVAEADCEFGRFAASEQPGMKTWRNFKTDLESGEEEIRSRARWLTRQFFGYLYRQYRQQSIQLGDNSDEEIVFVSYPAKYGPKEREIIVSAAREAGFRNVRGITEPEAAVKALMVQGEKELREQKLLSAERPAYLLFADMGAGTTDLAVCRYEKGRTEILTTWPDEKTSICFGGKEIDSILCGFVENYLRQNSEVVPSYFTDNFREKYIETIKTWKEITVSRTLKRGKEVAYFEAVKNPFPLLPDFSPMISRRELENTACEYLKNFAVLVNGCLEEAAKGSQSFAGGESVDLVFLTGGHSQWYFIPEILTGKAPRLGEVTMPKIQAEPSRIRISGKPQDTVAVGMAYALLREKVSREEPKNKAVDEQTVLHEDSVIDADAIVKADAQKQPTPPRPLTPRILTKELAEQMFAGVAMIQVPEGFCEIGEDAFNNFMTNSLKGTFRNMFAKNPPRPYSVSLPKGLRHIRKSAFEHCGDLSTVSMPEGLISIGNAAFDSCKDLRNVTIPGSVQSIGIGAFSGCTSLRKIVIPDGIRDIPQRAFYGCANLDQVTIPKSVRKIGDSAFAMCKILNMEIPDGVQEIGASAFSRCTWGMKNVKLPGSVRAIGHSAFNGCSAISTIEIPEGVRKIAWDTFKNCTLLSSVTIPVSVKEIEDSAFLGCKSYMTIKSSPGSCAEAYARKRGFQFERI